MSFSSVTVISSHLLDIFTLLRLRETMTHFKKEGNCFSLLKNMIIDDYDVNMTKDIFLIRLALACHCLGKNNIV